MASILIVDDRPANRKFLLTLLGYAGHRLLEAEDGAQALEIARREHPDLIITDILMPVMDGYELARQLREEQDFDNATIIFYTATYQAREARSLAKAAGVQYVLTKPAEPQAILDLVNAALGKVPASIPPAEISTKPLLDPLQVVSAKLTAKMSELGGLSFKLSELIELGISIGGERNPQSLLEKFCESARKILKAKYAAVGILARESTSFEHFITSGMDAETVAGLGNPPTGQGILGALINEHEAIRLHDLTADPRSVGFPPGHPMMRSFLGVRIGTSLRTYGNLYLTEKLDAEEFSEEDERLAHTLASQVAVAYENAYMYYDIQRHATNLQLEMTERKKSQAALTASESRFRAMVEHSTDAIAVNASDGTVLYVSPAVERITGIHAEIGQKINPFERIHPEDLELSQRMLEHIMQNPLTPTVVQFRIQHPDGDWRWVEVAATNMIQEPSVGGIVVNFADITERKRAEEALRNSEEQFRRAVQDAPYPIQIHAEDGEVILINQAWTDLTGYNLGDIPTIAAWTERAYPGRASRIQKYIQGLFDVTSRVDEGEDHIITASGETRTWKFSSAPLGRLPDGRRLVISMAVDITEGKQAEEALANSEKRFRSLVEHAPDGIALLGLDGRLQQITPTVQQILGYTTDESIGQDPARFTHPDDLPDLLALLNDLIQNPGKVARTTYRFMHKDGSWRWLESTVSNLIAETSVEAIVFNYRDITEPRRAEESLREAEAKYRILVEQLPAITYIAALNASGSALYVSPQIRQLGFSPADWLADPEFFLNHLHPEDRERVRAELRRTGETGEPFQSEYRLQTRAGEYRWFRDEAIVVRNEAGEALHLQGIMLDITERRRADKRIRYQVEKLNALRTIDMAISTSFDMNLSLTVLLNQAKAQLEVSAAAILLFDPLTLMLEYAVGKGFASTAIQRTRLRLGESIAGRVALERRRSKVINLREAGERFARTALLKEEEFVSYYAAPLVAKGELKGVFEVFSYADIQADREWLDFVETLAGQAAIAIDNAQLFANLQRANLNLEHRVFERTAELNQTNAELERANRTKDEFLANMSHELRTPLTSILGLSEALLEQKRGSLNEFQQGSLQIVESSGRHLLELINDILDLSKLQAGKFDFYPQVISVDELCRSSLAFVKAQAAKKSIRLNYLNEAAIPRIHADPRRLKQILVNLLGNAVKFTPDNGNVTLQVRSDLEQELIRFAVLDTGIGIAHENLQRLFQPFVQVQGSLNREYEGTGLGLALIQKLTDMHGGSVQVESEVGVGSQFIIILPLQKDLIAPQEMIEAGGVPSAAEAAVEAKLSPSELAAQGLILLAEDNSANILTIGEYLKSHGYEIVVARDGLEAIQQAEAVNPEIILMDIQMPVMDGLEAIRRLRKDSRFAKTPIIALTALAMPGDRERCLEAGANEYMSKPVQLKSLVKTIEGLLGQRNH